MVEILTINPHCFIHSGIGKPKCLKKYLSEFIQELNYLIKNGEINKEKKISYQSNVFYMWPPL